MTEKISTTAPGTAPTRSGVDAGARLGLLLVTLSTIAWSTTGYFTRLIPLDAWTILFWRGIFGALTALAFIIAQERAGTWRAFAGMGRTGLMFSLLSTLGMVVYLAALK